MNNDRIPSREESFDLMKRYAMFDNIVDHSLQVERVALAIADNLTDPTMVSRDLVSAAALLHDITKSDAIRTGDRHHDLTGAELLSSLGMAQIADIVRDHVNLSVTDTKGALTEKEIVYYADKRVMHDVVVSLDTRTKDLLVRYGIDDAHRERIRINAAFAKQIEDKITRNLARSLDEIVPS